MNSRRDNRNHRVSLFDGIEEDGIRASSLYSSSHEIDEHDNEQAMDGLQDRVNLLKILSGDIHEEVDGHNRMLDRMLHSLTTTIATTLSHLHRCHTLSPPPLPPHSLITTTAAVASPPNP